MRILSEEIYFYSKNSTKSNKRAKMHANIFNITQGFSKDLIDLEKYII